MTELRPLLEAIVSNVEEAITVVDLTGRFVFVNDEAASLLGFESAAALMNAESRAVRDRYQVVDEGLQPVSMMNLPSARALKGETPKEMVVGWRLQGSGQLRWSVVRSVPVKGSDGRVELVITFFKDVTEQRRAAAQDRFLTEATVLFSQSLDLDATLQQLAAMTVPELADWAVAELAEPGASASAQPWRVAIAHVDPAKVELVREIRRRWPAEPDEASRNGVAAVLRTGRPLLMSEVTPEVLAAAARDAEHLAALETLAMGSLLCVPLVTQRHEVVGKLTLLTGRGGRRYQDRDVPFAIELGRRAGTAIENAHLFAALEDANRHKDDFLAMLGHELRNPLAPMVNAVALLKQSPGGERSGAVISRQLEQLTRLVDDLLDVSRISRGKIELRREVLDFGVLVAEVAADHLDTFHGAGLELHTDWSPGVSVDGDRARLQQVVGNLLGNALKFTPAGGEVRISVKRDGARVALAITDSGVGIDSATLPKLFQPFVQARTGLDRKSGGLGLGLAVVRGIVELHGGEVAVSSLGAALGSTFRVTLPVVESARATPAVAAAATVKPSRSPRELTVLVIDDNVDLANTMRDLLAFEAKQVNVEHSGVGAVDRIRQLKPDVVICDIGLPVKDGYAIASEVRADRSLDGVRLIALSGYGMDADKERAEAAGFSRHLTKPVPPDELMRLLDEA